MKRASEDFMAGSLFRWLDFFDVPKIAGFAALNEFLRDRFKLFPPGADGLGFGWGDLAIRSGGSHRGEQVGKILNDAVHGWHQMKRRRLSGMRIPNEKAAGLVTNPLDDRVVVVAFDQDGDAIKRVGSAAGAGGRFGPFID